MHWDIYFSFSSYLFLFYSGLSYLIFKSSGHNSLNVFQKSLMGEKFENHAIK